MANHWVNIAFPALLLLLLVAMNFMLRLIVPFEWLFGVMCLACAVLPSVSPSISFRDLLRQPLFWLVAYMLLHIALIEQSSDPSKLFTVVAQLTLSGVILLVLPRLVAAPSLRWLRGFAMALVLGYAITFVEGAADFPLYRLLSGYEGHIQQHQLKWVEIALFLFTLPVVYGCVREKLWGFVVAFPVLVCAILWGTITQANILAVAVALVAFPLGFVYGKTLFRLSVGGLVVLALAMPFIAQFVFRHYVYDINKMPFLGSGQGNGAPRLEIYNAVADKIMLHPWFGYGVDAVRKWDNFFTDRHFYESPHIYHPHNFLLHLWMDLGLAGLAIGLAVLVWVLRLISRQQPLLRAFGLSAFAAGFSIAFVGYGIWQSWMIATFVLTAMLFVVVGRMPFSR